MELMNLALIIDVLVTSSIFYYISTHLFHIKEDKPVKKIIFFVFLILYHVYVLYCDYYGAYFVVDVDMLAFLFVTYCLFDENPIYIYVICYTYMAISDIAWSVSSITLRILFHIPFYSVAYGQSMSIIQLVVFCISLGVEICVAVFILCKKRPLVKFFENFSYPHLFLGYHIFYVFFLNLLYLIVNNFLAIKKIPVVHLLFSIFLLMMFILSFCSCLFFGFFENYYCKKNEKKYIEKQKQTIVNYYNQYQNIYSQYYKLNHDYKNHISVSLQNNDYNRLIKQKYEDLYHELDLMIMPEIEIYDDMPIRKISRILYIVEIIIYFILVLFHLNGNLISISLFFVILFLALLAILYFSVYKERKIKNDIQIMQQKMMTVSLESDSQQMKKKMKQLLSDLDIQNKETMQFSVLDILIELKTNKMKELSIHHNIQVSLPYDCFLENVDSISLFSNLLDNAIEACEQCDQKNIDMKVEYKKGVIYIHIENSLLENHHPIDNQFHSQKQDRIHHGWGMKIIQEIVDKYEGEMVFEEKENVFITKIIL